MSNIINRELFHKNLNMLRALAKLGKGEFSELIGVKNLYRKDFNTIGPKMMYGINAYFQGVTEHWLTSEHPEGTEGIIFTSCKTLMAELSHLSTRIQ